MKQRNDYINWDEYFMGIALLSAMRSKDPNSQVGAMPWGREGEPLDTKYMYVCHAELNAILNSAHNNLKGARIYVTLFPCNECTKAIIQSGIGEIVYYDDKYHDSDSSVAARFMLKKAGVRLTPYHASGRQVEFTLAHSLRCISLYVSHPYAHVVRAGRYSVYLDSFARAAYNNCIFTVIYTR